MDEEPTSNVEEHMEGESGMSSKRIRHRKKQLYKDIRKQMEFYFGDANLTKDRFLGELVMQDPNIDISIFIRFNKIRAMTTDVKDIANALRNSELLEVSEDGAKIFRKIQFKPKENTDDCTIYVEQLPPDAQHDWLNDVFSAHGRVAYVSIPKFKSTGKIKGFAFVEFETPEEANKTLEAFGLMGCHLSTQMAPEKLCSIATFESEEKKYEEVPDKEIKGDTNEIEINQSLESPSKKKKKKKKVKLEPSEETITEDSKNTDLIGESEILSSTKVRKRKKTQEEAEESETETGHVQTDEDSPPKRKKKSKSGDIELEAKEELQETNAEEAICSVHSTVVEPQMEKKNKKKKSENAEEKLNSYDETVDAIESMSRKKRKRGPVSIEETDECKVTSSDDIKRHSEKKKKTEDDDNEDQPTDMDNSEVQNTEKETDLEITETGEEEMVEGSSKKKRKRKKKHKKEKQDVDASRLQILSKKEWKRLRNKYLDLQKTKMKALKRYLNNKWNRNAGGFRQQYANGHSQEKEEHDEESAEVTAGKQETVSKPKISFTPGVIVHANFDEPILDLRKFKADTKALSEVQYIDVVMGANEAFIRCASATAAENLVTNSPWHQKGVLKGEEEKNYWEKIFKDRELKFSKNIRVKQRGRDKILRRAERELGKHIKFDD